MNKTIKEQQVVRTYPSDFTAINDNLKALLRQGYYVVLCNKIGEALEYIVERKIEVKEDE